MLKYRRIGFEGEGDPAPEPTPPVEKTYSEAEFNTHTADLRRKYESREEQLKTTQRQLAQELERLKKGKGVTDEERAEFDKRIKSLEDNFLTEREKMDRKATQQKSQYEAQIQDLSQKLESQISLHRNETVKNSIFAHSKENKGIDPDQFYDTLHHRIEWEQELVDGEPNGRHQPFVKLDDTDKDGKPVVLKYSIPEAIKRMREMPKYHNYFEDTLKGGLGGRANSGSGVSGSINAAKLAKENPAEFRRLRKEDPDRLYGSKRR